MTFSATNIDKLCIDSIRCLAMDTVQKANSGHPGAPMGQAPAAYTLWTKFMRHNPTNPTWADRDRFVLSSGHASVLIYSLLHLSGYDVSMEDLKSFRQWDSKTPGHPEFGHTPGVETTTGPLGMGIGNAVGMAIAERWMSDRFNRPGHEIVNHRTFAFGGDGCMMEGVAQESMSLAGHLGLEKLVVLYDSNHITIDGSTDISFTEDVEKRVEAQGWRVLKVEDGQNPEAIAKAFDKATKPCGKPTLIICNTIIGYPSPNKQNSHACHGAPLGEAEIRATKEVMGWNPDAQFTVPAEALAHWRESITKGQALEADWKTRFEAYAAAFPEAAQEFQAFLKGELPAGWQEALPVFGPADKQATREAGNKVLNALATSIPNLIGGSADLAGSNLTHLKDGGAFSRSTTGRNFNWGVREHGMSAILNGMSVHGGMRVFGATFLVFCDFMRGGLRLACLMKQPVTYVLTHDSIGVGEDGPTHQPIEQIASMRMIPGMTVMRPADANETAAAWKFAIEHKTGPTVLALTRQKLPVLDAAKTQAGVPKGAYIIEEASAAPKLILIATGSEVHLAIQARTALEAEGIPTRVVSMPSCEVFSAQDKAYRESVLPAAVTARISIEAGTTFGWERYTGTDGAVIGIDHFGASAPADILFEQFGFTVDNVVKTAKRIL